MLYLVAVALGDTLIGCPSCYTGHSQAHIATAHTFMLHLAAAVLYRLQLFSGQ